MAQLVAALLADMGAPRSIPEQTSLDEMEIDFRFVLERYDVPPRMQARLGSSGYRSLSLFGVLADDRTGVRTMLTNNFSLDATELGFTQPQKAEVVLMQTRFLTVCLTANQQSQRRFASRRINVL